MTKEIKNGFGGLLLCCLIFITMVLLTEVLLTSCTADMDDSQLKAQPKAVVFCFPNTETDTTQINVTRSLPVSNKQQNVNSYNKDGSLYISDATVSFKVNGTPREVKYATDTIGSVPRGMYYTVGKIRPGDEISIDVSAPGLPSASARTIVNEPLPISNLHIAHVRHDDTEYNQLVFDFDGSNMAGKYYAVTVDLAYHAKGENYLGEKLDADFFSRQSIDTSDEPLLGNNSDDDVVFDFSSDAYDNFYVFNGNNVKSGKYTMRLNIVRYNYNGGGWGDTEITNTRYVVHFYRVAPELFRFLKSINDMQGNDLAQYGLAPILPTYSNVHGGIGVVGGCAASKAEIKFSAYD